MVQDLGTADIDARLEELLIDGILYAFQEQARAKARRPMGQQQAPSLVAPPCMPGQRRALPAAQHQLARCGRPVAAGVG